MASPSPRERGIEAGAARKNEEDSHMSSISYARIMRRSSAPEEARTKR